ncbi:Subtilisin-like protease SBT1.7 [Striga hermonthica]|uniref:Subtilisin-like protease SBT1.7 n=1 Tax=Striga hermonthica TaxID=68872 RepID=A0A9N7NH65_STRHE|nr:Subtilisin-like protease SBT1.7 [Striga hermonthica]
MKIPTTVTVGILLLVAIFHVSMAAKKTYIVHMSKSKMPAEFNHHTHWYASTLKSVSGSDKMLYAYDQVIHGFAGSLTDEEARLMASRAGVLSVQPDSRLELSTTRTPTFLGLDRLDYDYKYRYILPDSRQQSIVIGVIDTGVWPESQSFNDAGYGPIPASWLGECQTGSHFDESMCNKKLIGARYFLNGYEHNADPPVNWTTEYRSARDNLGHGTHTASIAAGSAVPGANLLGYANGMARGMAPRARVAIYKVCWVGGCYNSDVYGAFDAAIKDGVDMLSISLGFAPIPFYTDSIAISTFTATANGIFVSCSGGNSGPTPFSAENTFPWVTSVGAGTIDRDFPSYVKLGNGKTYTGTSLYRGPLMPYKLMPIVYAGQASKNGSGGGGRFCLEDTLNPKLARGKIVLCDRGINNRVEKGAVVKKAGGAGMVLANTNVEGEELILDAHLLPAVDVGQKAGDEMRKYLSTNHNPTAMILLGRTRFGVEPSPVVANFSSRGPSSFCPQVLKPDLIAPGVNILAAWSRAMSPTELSIDTRRVDFNIQTGTSMSCPHVSGLAALLKASHPDWSPAAIRSALMTTAYTTDKRGNHMIDASRGKISTPFDYGAGHVNPILALDPGLVYNITPDDYLNFLCALNYTPQQIQIITQQNFTCDPKNAYNTTDLNYPSFAVQVPADINTTRVVTHKRVVTNVGSRWSTYMVSISSPSNSVKISVVPNRLTFHKRNEMRSYTVTFEITGPMPPDTHKFGEIKWCDWNNHVVRSPIAISWT